MKEIIENKILDIVEQMKALETEHNFYLKPNWKELRAQQMILHEVLSEERVTRAAHLQRKANREIDLLGEAYMQTVKELEQLTDSFNEVERNAFLRVMGAN